MCSTYLAHNSSIRRHVKLGQGLDSLIMRAMHCKIHCPLQQIAVFGKEMIQYKVFTHKRIVSKCAKVQKSTAPGIPKRSPIQVLTGPDVA